MNRPAASIVIPCFNQSEYLKECLASVLAQTVADWEAIVVDDASTRGNPAEICGGIADARIRCVRHDRKRGLGTARNTGFRAARAAAVAPLDADDMLAPTYLERPLGVLSDRSLR